MEAPHLDGTIRVVSVENRAFCLSAVPATRQPRPQLGANLPEDRELTSSAIGLSNSFPASDFFTGLMRPPVTFPAAVIRDRIGLAYASGQLFNRVHEPIGDTWIDENVAQTCAPSAYLERHVFRPALGATITVS
jgi:hypothetical protein